MMTAPRRGSSAAGRSASAGFARIRRYSARGAWPGRARVAGMAGRYAAASVTMARRIATPPPPVSERMV